jgi:amidase
VTAIGATRPVPVLRAPVEPAGWPAWRIREAVVSGELTVPQVIAAHLDRIEEVDRELNAAALILRDDAMAAAYSLQESLDAGAEPGPLCGVPFSVKDVIAAAGSVTACGSAVFAGNVPTTDAVAVRLLREAGAILVAKGNCPEFAFGVTTESLTRGVTLSPWGTQSPGGSSGGDAVLVATGAVALALGTDYGGSLRWPAQCCGVLALRPGLGSVDGTGQLPGPSGRMDGSAEPAGAESVQRHFQVVGPLARETRDLALSFAVLAVTPPADGEAELDGLRVGWLCSESSGPVSREVQDIVRGLAARLSAARLQPAEVPGLFDGLHETYNRLRDTDDLADLRAAVGLRRGLLGSGPARILDAAPASTADPAPLWRRLDELRSNVLAQLAETPVLIFPVAPAATCDLDGVADVDGLRLSGFEVMAQCRAVTALGLPVVSIPVGRDRDGRPVSVQVIARPGHEEDALRVAALLERSCGGRQEPAWLAG